MDTFFDVLSKKEPLLSLGVNKTTLSTIVESLSKGSLQGGPDAVNRPLSEVLDYSYSRIKKIEELLITTPSDQQLISQLNGTKWYTRRVLYNTAQHLSHPAIMGNQNIDRILI